MLYCCLLQVGEVFVFHCAGVEAGLDCWREESQGGAARPVRVELDREAVRGLTRFQLVGDSPPR